MVRLCPARTSKNTPIATMADAPIAAEPMRPVRCPSQRRPKRPFTRNAASGKAGMSQTCSIIS